MGNAQLFPINEGQSKQSGVICFSLAVALSLVMVGLMHARQKSTRELISRQQHKMKIKSDQQYADIVKEIALVALESENLGKGQAQESDKSKIKVVGDSIEIQIPEHVCRFAAQSCGYTGSNQFKNHKVIAVEFERAGKGPGSKLTNALRAHVVSGKKRRLIKQYASAQNGGE